MDRTRIVLVSSLVAGLSAIGTNAMAALPTGATDLFTSVATDGGLVIAAAFTAAVVLTGGWIVFDMVKKGAKKAAK